MLLFRLSLQIGKRTDVREFWLVSTSRAVADRTVTKLETPSPEIGKSGTSFSKSLTTLAAFLRLGFQQHGCRC